MEGPSRGIPFLQKKCKCRVAIQFWKYKVKVLKGRDCDTKKTESKRLITQIEESQVNLEEALQKLKEEEENWNEIKINGKKHRENKLLDL